MQNTIIKPIKDIMEQSFIDYSMSVIVDRALPDVRDGLKPVHRRILFAMHEASNTWNKAYKKSARMVGDVIGKYHPHGDTSVYGAAVRMAQPFSMGHPLIDGQGNFGSVDGDNAAAMRYTEMRMTRLAGEMFTDLEMETVAFLSNYDGSESEPSVLTASYPNLLVNGVDGIAVGMASCIPPHNLRAVVQAALTLIDNPDAPAAEIAAILDAPDFPTGGIVYGADGFLGAVESGRGKVRLRSKWHEEERKRGVSLVIDEIPFQVNKAKMVIKIAELVHDKKIDDIVGLRDESSKEGMRVVVEIKAGGSAETVFAQLCDMGTDLETSISYNCVVLDGGIPKQIGLRYILVKWIAFRKDVVLKRHIFLRKNALGKLHILQGYITAIGMLDKVIETIRAAVTPVAAQQALIALLGIDEAQADAVLSLRLQKLTGLELNSLYEDHAQTTRLVADLTEIINEPERVSEIIKTELTSIADRYGCDRRSEVQHGLASIEREDMITREPVLIAMTRGGYIKRMPANALTSQNRGTRGKRMMDIGDDDEVSAMYQCESHDLLMVFAQSGQVYGVKAYRIPEGGLTSKGRHIRNVIDGLDEEISTVMALSESDPSLSIVTVTKNGQIKRTDIASYASATRKGGVMGVGLDEGDSLLSVYACHPHDHVMLIANTGRAIRFDIEDVRVMGRTAGGVRGMRVDEGGHLVGSYVIRGNGKPLAVVTRVIQDDDGADQTVATEDTSEMDHGRFLVCIGEKGVGKRTPLDEFTLQHRGGKGVTAFKTTPKTGLLATALGATLDNDLIMFATNGVSNRISVASVREAGRSTSGVYLMNIDDGHKVASVTTALQNSDEAGENVQSENVQSENDQSMVTAEAGANTNTNQNGQ